MFRKSFFAIVISFVLAGCLGDDLANQKWTAWIYPSKENTKKSLELGVYTSLEECKNASIKKMESLNILELGDYKCGLNCNYNNNLKMLVCEKLTK